jgi:sterol desaturase/sphingolipid hydroxylase (fatty acid hydroxylase superfamily)
MAARAVFNGFIEKTLAVILEPFESWERFLSAVSHGLHVYGIDLNSKTAFPYMLSSLLIAGLVYQYDCRTGRLRNSSFVQYVFPRSVYLHPSAVTDYKFVAVDLSIKLLVYVPLFSGISWLLYKSLYSALRPIGVDLSSSVLFSSAFMPGLVGFLLADFGFFLSHYLMHKIPALWVFHEVHHSAEVLTPITVHRVHPVEELLNGLIGSSISAVGAATYSALSEKDLVFVEIFGVNAISFMFFAFDFQLRHSHVWLSYGSILSRILISPAQHQIHHSQDPQHWDKNFGFTLAVWDACFRSLYVPRAQEAIRFGLPYGDPSDFSSVSKLYFLPFKKALQVLRRTRKQLSNVKDATSV